MALSYLKFETTDGNDAIFTADIGSNRVYHYKIGADARRVDDQDVLGGVGYESPVQQLELVNPFNSGFELRIPLSRFEQPSSYVQLISYRSAAKNSPAWSKVCKVRAPTFTRPSLSGSRAMSMIEPIPTFKPARSVTFSVAESRFSTPMFLDQLLEVAKLLVPSGSEYLSGLLKQNTPFSVTPTMIAKVITGVLDALQKESSGNTATTASVSRGQALRMAEGFSRRSVAKRNLVTPASLEARARLARSLDMGLLSGPLLAGLIGQLGPSVLKAVGPLFQNAPQMLQGILDNPVKLLNAINQADLAQRQLTEQRIQNMLAQGNQALMVHLLLNNGQGGNPALAGGGLPTSAAALLKAQSLTPRKSASPNVDQRIRLRFVWPENNDIGAVYNQGSKWSFRLQPYTEHTPPSRPIPEARVKLQIKRLDKVLFEKRYRFSDVMLGETLELPLFGYEGEKLPLQTDLTAVAEFAWRTPKGEVVRAGNRGLYEFRISGPLFIQSLGSRRHQEKSLSDPAAYRVFWHRIWEGGTTQHNRWDLNVTARYYYTLAQTGEGNGRMETKFKAGDNVESGKTKLRLHGMMKSGMQLDPQELLKLLPLFGEADWAEEEKQLLEDDRLASRVNQQASAHLELRGRDDERGSLWVFPVVDLIDVAFHRVVEVGEDGAVTQTREQSRALPLPVSSMFVGAKLEN